jgi:hypothetical protein
MRYGFVPDSSGKGTFAVNVGPEVQPVSEGTMSQPDSLLDPLQAEQHAFNEHLEGMLAEHPNEFVVFHDGKVAGFFKTYDEAYGFALDSYGLDAVFLISQVIRRDTQPASVSWQAGVMFG